MSETLPLSAREAAQVVSMVDRALAALWRQHEALERLAMHYPEAHRVLSDPRKPESIVILERLRHWLTNPERTATRPPAPPEEAP